MERVSDDGDSTFYVTLGRYELVDAFTYNYWMKLSTRLPEPNWFAKNAGRLAFTLAALLAAILAGYAYWIRRTLIQPLGLLSDAIVSGDLVDAGTHESPVGHISKAFNAHIERSRSLAEALQREALTDPLTGLYNRKALNSIYPNIVRIAQRTEHLLGLLFIDLDHFKGYNDTYGHVAGDEALVTLAAIIGSEFRRPTDLAIRLGGEEFLVLYEANTLQGACVKAEALRQALLNRQIEHLENRPLGFLSLSAGLLVIDPSKTEEDLESLLKCADQLLYSAKSKGRNRIESSDSICCLF